MAQREAHGAVTVSMDEIHLYPTTNIRNAWYLIGSKPQVPLDPIRHRITMFGALSKDSFIFEFYDKANKDSHLDFIKILEKEFGRVTIVHDNASYHRHRDVFEYIKSRKGRISLIYLPPYTPELNPIEIQWRVLRKCISNGHFESIRHLKKKIDRVILSNQMKLVKLHDYLIF